MKVLIAGATGLVGSALKEFLISNSIQVVYLTRSKQLTAKDSNAYYWNPGTNTIDDSCFKSVHAIINLSGTRVSRPWTKRGKQILVDSRIESARLLKNSIQKYKNHKIKQYVSASAIGIYSSESNICQTEENFKKAKSFLSTLVQNWEKESLKFEQNNIKTTLLRFGHIFSNKGGFYPILNMFLFGRIGLILGRGRQIYSWIHIDDAVQIIYEILRNQWLGVYNLVAPDYISQKELTKNMASFKKHRTKLISVPSRLIMLFLGERGQLILNGQSVSAQKLLDKGYVFKFPTIHSCIKDLKVTK